MVHHVRVRWLCSCVRFLARGARHVDDGAVIIYQLEQVLLSSCSSQLRVQQTTDSGRQAD